MVIDMEQNKPKKKRHIGLKIFLIFILLLLTAAAGIVIYFYPLYSAAGYMSQNLTFREIRYTAKVSVDREELDADRRKLLDTLAELTGTDRAAMYRLSIEGQVDGDIIYARIYPEGWEEPLLELYLSDGVDVVNGAMLYSAVREHLCGQNKPLELLLPVWDDREYVSLEQAEEMLGVDLSSVRRFKLSFRDKSLSRWECFGILLLTEKVKTEAGEGFLFRTEGLDAAIWLKDHGDGAMSLTIDMEEPAEVLGDLRSKFSGVGISFEGEGLRILDELYLMADMKEVALQMPDDLIGQSTVDVIKSIRLIIERFIGN